MLINLATLQKKSPLTQLEVTSLLQQIFITSFLLKSIMAIAIFLVCILLLPPARGASFIIKQTLLITELLLLPSALLTAKFFFGNPQKSGQANNPNSAQKRSFASVISLATLLATSLWITLFAWFIGIRDYFLLGMIFIYLSYYALGLRLTRNYVGKYIYSKNAA